MNDLEPPIGVGHVPGWDRSADVLVLGLGVAGVCAALEAHRSDADVLVIERASAGGGASATSEGIFYLGGGTSLQRDLAVEDSPDDMYAFMRASTTTPDDDMLRLFCDESPAHFDWLEAQGVPFERKAFIGKAVAVNTGEGLLSTGNEKVWPFRDIAKPAMRGHQTRAHPGERGGIHAMNALLATFAAEGIDAMYDTRVVGFVVDETGRVVGAKVRHAGEDRWVEGRRGVILATGSFNLNDEMTSANLPVIGKYGTPLGIETNDGAGVLLGESVGVDTQGMDGVIATASIYPPADNIKGIVVNSLGRRFVAEDSYHGRLAWFVERQPDHRAWLILDEEIFGYPTKGSHTMVGGFETIAELEQELDMPAGSVAGTLAEYNRDVADGIDRQFRKHPDWLKALEPPFVAFDISITSSDYHYISLGGLHADTYGRALDASGQPVPGLYAVGACAAHFPQNGAEYASGMSLGPGSFFGRRAGRHAALGGGELA
ncbi:MAG: FAD-dependent oxidoreductase [Acidimicrobiales bacterium]